MSPRTAYAFLEGPERAAGREEIAVPVVHAHTLKPGFELGRRTQAEETAHVHGVMEGSGLIVEHHVVRAGNTDDVIASGRGQHGQKDIHVILIRVNVIRVADVAPHGHAHELGAEVVLQARPDDLLAVGKVFRAHESDHRVHDEGPVAPRHGVGAGLYGLLVATEIGVSRKTCPLPRFEIHAVIADRAAPQALRGVPGLVQDGEADAEARVGLFRSGQGLEGQIHGNAAVDKLDGVGHVREHAALGRDMVSRNEAVQHAEETGDVGQTVRGRVDADDGVAGTVVEAVDGGRQDAFRVVGGMIGLQPCGEAPLQAQRVAESDHDAALGSHADEILEAHNLADRSRHLGSYTGGDGCQGRRVSGVREQPVAELSHGEGGNGCEGLAVMAVHDQPGDFIVFIRNDRLVQETLQRHIGQSHLRADALFPAFGSHSGQDIPRSIGGRLGKEFAEGGKF